MLIRITSLQHFTVRFGNECDPPSDQVQRSEMLGQPKKIACLQRLQSGTFEFVGLSGGTTDNQIAVLVRDHQLDSITLRLFPSALSFS